MGVGVRFSDDDAHSIQVKGQHNSCCCTAQGPPIALCTILIALCRPNKMITFPLRIVNNSSDISGVPYLSQERRGVNGSVIIFRYSEMGTVTRTPCKGSDILSIGPCSINFTTVLSDVSGCARMTIHMSVQLHGQPQRCVTVHLWAKSIVCFFDRM